MLPRARTVSALCLCLGLVALFATGAQAADPPVQVLVPNSGFAVLGDGQTPGLTAVGPASTYRNPALGQNNKISIRPDREYPYYGGLQLIVDDLAPANRRLSLDIKTPTPIAYTCVKGPEDPGNPNGPRWGAKVGISGGKAQLLCFDQTGNKGYMVYTTTSCVTVTSTGPSTTDPLLTHYVIDGRGCQANVYVKDRNKLTPISYGSGKHTYYKVFDFPIYFEADGEAFA
jgi:hypothetical protein